MSRKTKYPISCLLLALAALTLLSCGEAQTPEIVVIEKQELPVVYFRAMISAGSAYDPDQLPGLACFTAHLLNKGTSSFSRDEIENTLDEIGAEIAIAVDKEVVVISGRTLRGNLDDFYPIFMEIVTAPSFPEVEVELQKEAQFDRINQIREDDRALALAVLENELYSGHRYGHLVEGNESSIKRFTREDAAAFYEDFYLRGSLVAGLAGAVDDDLVARFKDDLMALPEGRIIRAGTTPMALHSRRVILIEKENRTQSQLRIGHLVNLTRRSPGYYAMRLLGCHLGEHRELFGRIPQEVREKRGLAYGAYAYTEYFKQAGWSKLQENGICRNNQYFNMWTYPKEENFEFCIKLMLSEMSKLAGGEIGQDGLDLVKSYVSNNFPFLIETPEKELGMRLDEIWYGTPGFVDSYQKKIRAADLTEVQEVARDELKPEEVLIVTVVSDGEAAKQELLSLVTALDLPSGAEEGELRTANDEIKATSLTLEEDDISIVKASGLFK